MSLSMGQQLSCHYQEILTLLGYYGGILINENSYASEGVLVVRMNPDLVCNVIAGLQNMGFLISDVNISGLQSYIYFRGYMY